MWVRSNPTGARLTSIIVRTSNPETMSSAMASESCATTRTDRLRRPRTPPPARPELSFNVSCTSDLDACSAGSRLNTTGVRSASAAVNSSTVRSITTSRKNGS